MQIGDATAVRLVALTDATDPTAQNNLGVVLQHGGRVGDAEQAFERAIALDGGMAVARRNLGTLLPESETTRIAGCWARVRADASDDDAWRALVRYHAARSECAAAEDTLARWDAAAAGTVAPAVERARWALDTGRPDLALTAIARARAAVQSPGSAVDDALVVRLDLLEARSLYQHGDAARALAPLERVCAVAPDDPEAELLRSFVLGELEAADAAAASRARAATLDPALARVDAALVAVPAVSSGAEPTGAKHGSACESPARPTIAANAIVLAAALRHKGYYEEARAVLTPFASGGDARTHAMVQLSLGVLHLQRGAPADAVGALVEAAQAARDAGEDFAAPALALAVARLLAGEIELADATARTVERASSPALVRAGALLVRALVAWRGGDLPGAHALLLDAAAHARGLEHTVRSVLAADLALLLVDRGAVAAAVSAGAAAVRLAPQDSAAYAAYARALSSAGDHAGARDAFARACELSPTDAVARYGLAFATGACGDGVAARAEFARATALSPVVRAPAPRVVVHADGPVVLPSDGSGIRAALVPICHPNVLTGAAPASAPARPYMHVDARLATGEYERALAVVESALARGAPPAEGLVRAGHALARSGQVALALDRYKRAAAAAPHTSAPELHVVRTLHRLGHFGEACERAAIASERWPDEPSFAALRARAAADRGAVDEAVRALDQCAHARTVSIAADAAAAFWADVACAWQALGAWDAAADAWSEAARAVPTSPSPKVACARALTRAGRPDVAESVLEELALSAPEFPDGWRARAELAIATGRLPAARAHLARVVRGDGGDVDAHAALAAAWMDAGHLDDAESVITRAISLDPEHPLALAVHAECVAAAGDPVAACALWRQALAASPVGVGATRARAGLRRFADTPAQASADQESPRETACHA